MNEQERLTRQYWTKEEPFVGFLWNKITNQAHVSRTFPSVGLAESWWNQKNEFCCVWTIKKGEVQIVFAK